MLATETEKTATENSIKVTVIFDEGEYKFYNGDEEVRFSYLPLKFDIRQGYRNFKYLEGTLINSESGNVSIQVPFLVSPKNFFGVDQETLEYEATPEYSETYTLLQGNTRYLYLQSVFTKNIELYNSLEDKSEFAEKELKVDPFYITVVDEELLKNVSYILWLQNSINNGVQKHRIFDEIRAFNEHLENLTKRNKQLPEKDRKSTGDLRKEAMKPFQIEGGVPRTYHWTDAAKNFPKWLGDLVNETGLFDLYFNLFGKYKKLVKLYRKCEMSPPDLREFYKEISISAERQGKPVTQSVVDAIYEEYLDKLPKPKVEVEAPTPDTQVATSKNADNNETDVDEDETLDTELEIEDQPERTPEELREIITKISQDLAVLLYQTNAEVYPDNFLSGVEKRLSSLAAFVKRQKEKWELAQAIQAEPEEKAEEPHTESSEVAETVLE